MKLEGGGGVLHSAAARLGGGGGGLRPADLTVPDWLLARSPLCFSLHINGANFISGPDAAVAPASGGKMSGNANKLRCSLFLGVTAVYPPVWSAGHSYISTVEMAFICKSTS